MAVTEDGGAVGLVYAGLRSDDGSWREVGWPEIRNWSPEQGFLWVHLDREEPDAEAWVHQAPDIDSIVQDALLAEETRPRAVAMDDALLLILRGVNLNPGSEPEDMVAIRLLVQARRVISTRHRPMQAVNDLRAQIAAGRGPAGPGAFVVAIAARLVDRMSGIIDALDDAEDEIEEQVVEEERRSIRSGLVRIRRQAIALRRYLAPQRDALTRIQLETFTWLDARDKSRLREVTDRVIRHVEDLDSVRERAAVIQDELMNRLSDRMNRNMYLLTIVATVMLPLGFVTGLLGVNVDGIPGAQGSPWAFAGLCAALVVLVAIEVWYLRRRGWF